MSRLFTALAIAVLGIAVLLSSYVIDNRLDELEQRVTTFETVRIEMVAPAEGGER